MKNVIHIIILSAIPILSLFSQSCGDKKSAGSNQIISVSIEPVKFITEQIVGNDFDINVLVPSGASPETYEPKPTQIIKVSESLFYINIGLIDFERELRESIENNSPDVKIVDLFNGIELIEGDGHDHEGNNVNGHGPESGHAADHEDNNADDHGHHEPENGSRITKNPSDMMQTIEPENKHSGHAHGTDPHIWASPACVKQMSETVYEALIAAYPDSVKYTENYEKFIVRLDMLDARIKEIFAPRDAKKTFIIYHPALSYLARDYGLTQISIEDEGKEPSAGHIKNLVKTARQNNITKLFYQTQFSVSTVKALSEELGIDAVEIDPLAYNIIDNTLYMCKLIAE